MSSQNESGYNPDVLSCLANLSNDEVFTPPEVANAMLNLLPQELFSDPDAKFLDPACKSGVFLREIAKRLIEGLADTIPDLQERVDHIFQEQLYAISITELTGLLSRRSVYCSKDASGRYSVSHFGTAQGNIFYADTKHEWTGDKCRYCGASRSEYGDEAREGLESHAYQFIHNALPGELANMKFDVIIGNPPYQLNDGGGANEISAKPIYHYFIQQAKRLQPRFITMIIPSRWFAGGKGLNDFRSEMINDKRIKTLVNYPKSRECFQGVDIAGGVCYFLWQKTYQGLCELTSISQNSQNTRSRDLSEFPIVVSDNIGVDIIHKVKEKSSTYLSDYVLPRNSFGFTTSYRGKKEEFPDCMTLISSSGKSFIAPNEVTKNKELSRKYKITIGTLNPDRGGVNNASDGKSSVTTKIKILSPNEVPTETYIVLDTFDDESSAENFASYISTRFARYLILLTISSMHIVRDNFIFVPMQDFSKPWTDEELYTKYKLTNEEIAFIESMIRPME